MSGIGGLSLSFSRYSVCEPRQGHIASFPAERAKARRHRAQVSWFVWSDGRLSLVTCLETTCSDAKAVPVIVSLPPRIKTAKSSVVIFTVFTVFPNQFAASALYDNGTPEKIPRNCFGRKPCIDRVNDEAGFSGNKRYPLYFSPSSG